MDHITMSEALVIIGFIFASLVAGFIQYLSLILACWPRKDD